MSDYCDVVDTARQYYNSSDADHFYFCIWGGEDLHLGIYENDTDSVFTASQRTVQKMAETLGNLGKGMEVLDIGAGFGGSARYLVKHYGCRVTALNLSEEQNRRNRCMNEEQGVSDSITVVDGSFEDIPFSDDSFDVVWSQDAILHSGKKERVLGEAARVLRPGGNFIFTDPMQADDCPEGVLDPILARIHLDSMGSPGLYRAYAAKHGMQEISFIDLSPQLAMHYARIALEMDSKKDELEACVSAEYIANMKIGLQHWVDGSNNGYLTWGIFHFKLQK